FPTPNSILVHIERGSEPFLAAAERSPHTAQSRAETSICRTHDMPITPPSFPDRSPGCWSRFLLQGFIASVGAVVRTKISRHARAWWLRHLDIELNLAALQRSGRIICDGLRSCTSRDRTRGDAEPIFLPGR